MKILLSILLIFPLALFSQETKSQEEPTVETTDTLENYIYDSPDKEASFPGGLQEMKNYLADNIRYPPKSLKLGEEGKVLIQFVVNKDGSIEQVKVLRVASEELGKEAMRVVSKMPKWTPAEMKGKAVRARCMTPINFILN